MSANITVYVKNDDHIGSRLVAADTIEVLGTINVNLGYDANIYLTTEKAKELVRELNTALANVAARDAVLGPYEIPGVDRNGLLTTWQGPS